MDLYTSLVVLFLSAINVNMNKNGRLHYSKEKVRRGWNNKDRLMRLNREEQVKGKEARFRGRSILLQTYTVYSMYAMKVLHITSHGHGVVIAACNCYAK